MRYIFLNLYILLISFNIFSSDFKLRNKSVYMGTDKWKWTLYIDKDTSNIQEISKVKYFFPEFYSRDSIVIKYRGDTLFPYSYQGSSLGTFEIKAVLVGKRRSIIDTLTDSLIFESKEVKSNKYSLKYILNSSSLKYTVRVHSDDTLDLQNITVVKFIIPKIIGLDEMEIKEISYMDNDSSFVLESFYSKDYELNAEIYLKDGTYVEKSVVIEKDK